ncbi:hypothetical protein [Rhodococcus spongiicola]|uniref:Uncharacterized protein n=1 Tax=Rhodococcus spongiicola TaxID=2487352 RepID=A0A3S3AEM3_9NOCA|nr:hypothetical protein [Rhodococcus spongiicola]RVW06292.1 hypothetical protein EF834_02255 [Rhodococcus spongiicola]
MRINAFSKTTRRNATIAAACLGAAAIAAPGFAWAQNPIADTSPEVVTADAAAIGDAAVTRDAVVTGDAAVTAAAQWMEITDPGNAPEGCYSMVEVEIPTEKEIAAEDVQLLIPEDVLEESDLAGKIAEFGDVEVLPGTEHGVQRYQLIDGETNTPIATAIC